MEIAEKYDFIVVDDSKLDCFIAEKIIQNTGKSSSVTAFMMPAEALKHIHAKTEEGMGRRTVILLDIQMPLMNGFEFVEAFEKDVPQESRPFFCINMLSSSINESDLIKARGYSCIHRFLNKPLNKEHLMQALEEWKDMEQPS